MNPPSNPPTPGADRRYWREILVALAVKTLFLLALWAVFFRIPGAPPGVRAPYLPSPAAAESAAVGAQE